MDKISVNKYYYSTNGLACLVLSTNIEKGGVNNKCRWSVPKVGTKSQGQKKTKPNKIQMFLSIL